MSVVKEIYYFKKKKPGLSLPSVKVFDEILMLGTEVFAGKLPLSLARSTAFKSCLNLTFQAFVFPVCHGLSLDGLISVSF